MLTETLGPLGGGARRHSILGNKGQGNGARKRARGKVECAHRQREDVGELGEAVQHKGDDSEGDVGAQDAKGGDADKVAEELLLLHGEAAVKDDGGQQIPAVKADLLAGRRAEVTTLVGVSRSTVP